MTNSHLARDLLNSVGTLVRTDQTEAKLQDFESFKTANKWDYQDAVALALDVHRHDLALMLMDSYESRFKETYAGDFTREEILNELSLNASNDSKKVFRRLTIAKRGHVSNLWTMHPITQITISAEGIFLTYKRYWIFQSDHSIPWKLVTSIRVRTKSAWKGMGQFAAKMTQSTCFVATSERTVAFDVSGSYPDFESTGKLLKTLEQFWGTKIEGTSTNISYED